MAAKQAGRHGSKLEGKTDLARLIHSFEVTNRAVNKSPKTTTWYLNNLRLFKGHLVGRRRSLTIDDIGLEVAREYVLYLQEERSLKAILSLRRETRGCHQSQYTVTSRESGTVWSYELVDQPDGPADAVGGLTSRSCPPIQGAPAKTSEKGRAAHVTQAGYRFIVSREYEEC